MPTPAKKTNKSVTFTPEAADQTLLATIETALAQADYASFSDLCKQALQQTLLGPDSPPTNAPSNTAIDLASILTPLQAQIAQFETKLLEQQAQQLDQVFTSLNRVEQQVEQWQTQSDRQLASLQTQINQIQAHLAEPQFDPIHQQLNDLQATITQVSDRLNQQVTAIQQQLTNLESIAEPLAIANSTPPAQPKLEVLTGRRSDDYPLRLELAERSPDSLVSTAPNRSKTSACSDSSEFDPVVNRLSSLLEDF